jgi:hypothetical protein
VVALSRGILGRAFFTPPAQLDDTTCATHCHPPENQFIHRVLFSILLSIIKIQKMNSKNNHAPDISYFRLSLMDFLRESHPERLKDKHFILSCTDAATAAYEQAIRSGGNPAEAAEQAGLVLFEGLHFSKHDTLVNILWNEFAEEVPEDEAKELAIRLLPECEPVFANYPLTDGFACEPEYELLYTELTGTIAFYLESHELQ